MLLHMLIAVAAPNDARLNNADTAHQITYKIDSQTAPSVTKIFYFFEEKRKFGADPGSEGGVYIGDYTQTIVDNVVILDFAGISVPADISNDKKWEVGNNSCSAGGWRGEGEFLVICAPRDTVHTTTSVFKYQIGRGVTGFFATCFIDKPCWFELQSQKGILATLPPTGL